MMSVKKLFVKLGHWLILLGTAGSLVLYHLLLHIIPHSYHISVADQILIAFVAVLVAGAMHHQRLSFDELAREDLLPRVEKLVRDISSSGITKVRDIPDLSRYLVERFRTVKQRIRIVDSRPAKSGQWSKEYIEARDRLLATKKTQERIVLINDRDDLKAVIALMNKHATKPLLVKYFTRADLKTLFSLLIIDEDQVHFGQGFLGDPDGPTEDVELQSGQAAKSFIAYFQILWGQARELKTLEKINTAEITRIEKELDDLEQPRLAVSTYVHQSYESLCTLTQGATRIEIISFPKLLSESKERSRYYETLSESVLRGTPHRRIIWNGDQAKFVYGWLQNNKELCKADELEIRFYRPRPNEPPFYFDLLDRHTVIFAQNLLGDHFTQTRDSDFIQMIAKYFDHIWESAIGDVIKGRSSEPNLERLNTLASELKE